MNPVPSLTVHVHELDGDSHVETQTAAGDEIVEVTKPRPLRFTARRPQP